MRFLCDEMLARLARWLRVAGHDAVVGRSGGNDRDLLARALAEDRLLLTRDREFPCRRGAKGRVILLEGRNLDGQARELAARLGIDWLHAPFSRCLVDNARLRPATGAEAAALPPEQRGARPPFTACPECGRVYWTGGHTRRMLKKLESWGASATARPEGTIL